MSLLNKHIKLIKTLYYIIYVLYYIIACMYILNIVSYYLCIPTIAYIYSHLIKLYTISFVYLSSNILKYQNRITFLYPPSDKLVSHVFRRFLSQFSTDFHEIL